MGENLFPYFLILFSQIFVKAETKTPIGCQMVLIVPISVNFHVFFTVKLSM
jgi:hypothetical protein